MGARDDIREDGVVLLSLDREQYQLGHRVGYGVENLVEGAPLLNREWRRAGKRGNSST